MNFDPRTIGAQIRMQMPLLTPLEARVVDTITGRSDLSEATALKEVAEDAGVSEAMVVKIAKKLGFNGFRDFRAALVNYNSLDVADLHQEISPDDSAADLIQKVFRTAVQALEETMSILDVEAFERAADILHRARNRDFYGLGGSAQIARDVAHKFLRIGLRATVHDDAHMMLMSAAMLGPDDAVMVFSHSGTTSAVVEALELARRSGARCIAVTNYADLARRRDRGRRRSARPRRARRSWARTRPRGSRSSASWTRSSWPWPSATSTAPRPTSRAPGARSRPSTDDKDLPMSKPVPGVVVVGSLHYDIMVAAPHRPAAGETVQGDRWYPKFGGKGGNQAVAAAKAGVPVRMLGAVGDDAFGAFLRENLRQGGVDDALRRHPAGPRLGHERGDQRCDRRLRRRHRLGHQPGDRPGSPGGGRPLGGRRHAGAPERGHRGHEPRGGPGGPGAGRAGVPERRAVSSPVARPGGRHRRPRRERSGGRGPLGGRRRGHPRSAEMPPTSCRRPSRWPS